MELFNFADLGSKLDDFFCIKKDVEQKLLESGEITQKMELQDFISYSVAKTIIYFSCNETIPFSILKGMHESYIIYTMPKQNEVLLNEFTNKLKEIQYDISKLTQMEIKDTLGLNYNKEHFFIKNGTYYK